MNTIEYLPCPHDWKWIHDWDGDPDVIGGTRDFSYRICNMCDEEDHETKYINSPEDDL